MKYKTLAPLRPRGRLRARPLLCVIALLLLSALPVFAEEEKPAAESGILVIYPEEADRKTDDDSVAAVARALFSLRYTAVFAEEEKAAALLDRYDSVIWCDVSETRRMDASVLENYGGALLALGRGTCLKARGVGTGANGEGAVSGSAEYSFDGEKAYRSSVVMLDPGRMTGAEEEDGLIETAAGSFPLVSTAAGTRYIPLADYTTPFAQNVLTREIARWKWPYESKMHVYTQYVTLGPVYPFVDLTRLMNTVESMVEKKMAFVISVMPIYEHADYPAMERFCDVLRYAQSNGGAVILHAPLLQNQPDPDSLAERLTVAAMNYIERGVYPLAMEIPSEWLFRDDLAGILGRCRTLFFSEMDAFANHAPEEYGLRDHIMQGHQQIVPSIPLGEARVSLLSTHATAVYLDLSAEEDETLEMNIRAAAGSPIPLQSLWRMDEALYFNDGHYLTWDKNTLTVDGTQQFIRYTPSEPGADFDYRRDAYYRFVRDLAGQNHTLIGISIVVLLIFLFLGRRSRKQMHRAFLIPREESGGEEESHVIR